MVDPHGRLWWTRAAITDDRSMPQLWSRLAPGQMPSLQDRSQHPARLRAPAEWSLVQGEIKSKGTGLPYGHAWLISDTGRVYDPVHDKETR